MTAAVVENRAVQFIRSRVATLIDQQRFEAVAAAAKHLGPIVSVARDLIPSTVDLDVGTPTTSRRAVSSTVASGYDAFVEALSRLSLGRPVQVAGSSMASVAACQRAAVTLATSLWNHASTSTPIDAAIEGTAAYCLPSSAAPTATVGVTVFNSSDSSIPPPLRCQSAVVKVTLLSLASAGPEVAIDGALTVLPALQTPAPEDRPPKGRPLPIGSAGEGPSPVANGLKGQTELPFSTAVAVVLDACISLYCDTDDANRSLSLGSVTSLITDLCQRSVTACRVFLQWIVLLFREPVGGANVVMDPRQREVLDRCVELAAHVLSQFGFEFPWPRLANFATRTAETKWPLQYSMMRGLVERVALLTFDDRLKATLTASIGALAPPSLTTLATQMGRPEGTAIFEAKPEFAAAVAEYAQLLASVHGVVPDKTTTTQMAPIPAMPIKRLLLKHRSVSLSVSGKFVPLAERQLEAADERLASFLFFVATPPIRSARIASARSLMNVLRDDGDTLQRDDIWISTAHELLQQMQRQETMTEPNGPTSVGVRWLFDGLMVLASEHFLRAAGVAKFFSSVECLFPLLGTIQVRNHLREAAEYYMSRLDRCRLAHFGAADRDITMRLNFATLECSSFFDTLASCLTDAAERSLKSLVDKQEMTARSRTGAVSVLATITTVGRCASRALLRYSDSLGDDFSNERSRLMALLHESGDPAWAAEVLRLWSHREQEESTADAAVVTRPAIKSLALRRDAEDAVKAADAVLRLGVGAA